MRQSVQAAMSPFMQRLEPAVSHMYLDRRMLVSTGVTHAVEPVEHALDLPWRDKSSGMPVTDRKRIAAEWSIVTEAKLLMPLGPQGFDDITTLMLDDDDITNLVVQDAMAIESDLKRTQAFADFAQWPADAQLGVMSLAWAIEPTLLVSDLWPAFKEAVAREAWDAAAAECSLRSSGLGLGAFKAAGTVLFSTASWTARGNASLEELVYDPALEPDENVLSGRFPLPLDVVIGVQAALRVLATRMHQPEYDPGAVDDIVEPRTQAALRAFQLDAGVPNATDQIDPRTRLALAEQLDRLDPPIAHHP